MRLLKWMAAFFVLLAVAFGVMAAKEIKTLNITGTGMTVEQLIQSAPDTAQKIGTCTLAAFACLALSVLMIIALVIIHLRDEYLLYKNEQRVYGMEISGYKAVFRFKVLSALLVIFGLLMILFGGYKTGKDMPSVPLAENKLCTKLIANVLYAEDGSPYYTFKDSSGTERSNTIEGIGKIFISPKKEIHIRYLKKDPSQNSVDFAGCYMPESKTYVAVFYTGVLFVLLSAFMLVVALAMAEHNVRENRRRGYVRRFDNINESARLFENYDEK